MYRMMLSSFPLLITLVFMIFNITGCATVTLWEKDFHDTSVVNNITKGKAHGFYSECTDVDGYSDNIIVIPFRLEEDSVDFPPIKEGYLFVSDARIIGLMINELNKKYIFKSTAFVKAYYWRVKDLGKNIQYRSLYKDKFFFANNNEGKIKFSGTDPNDLSFFRYNGAIGINFIESDKIKELDKKCNRLTAYPIDMKITFIDVLMKHEYKRDLPTRVVLTPLAASLDIVTSPLQVLAIATLPFLVFKP